MYKHVESFVDINFLLLRQSLFFWHVSWFHNFEEKVSPVLLCAVTLGGDKASMFTHTYPHKPLGKIKVTICNHQADSSLYVSELVIYKFRQVWSYMTPNVLTETRCH